MDDHGTGGDPGAMADLDIAEDLGAGADHDPSTDFWMAIARFLAGPTERDIVQDRNVVLNQRGFADDKSGGMVEKNAAADACGGVNIGLEYP